MITIKDKISSILDNYDQTSFGVKFVSYSSSGFKIEEILEHSVAIGVLNRLLQFLEGSSKIKWKSKLYGKLILTDAEFVYENVIYS